MQSWFARHKCDRLPNLAAAPLSMGQNTKLRVPQSEKAGAKMLSEPASDTSMNWNVVVTTFDRRGITRARRFLQQYGKVERTHFYNVLVVEVPDIDRFVKAVAEALSGGVEILNDISRIVPAHVTFDFEPTSSFEAKAIDAVLKWSERLASRSFHVRLHRRRGTLQSSFLLSSRRKRLTRPSCTGSRTSDSPAVWSSQILISLLILRPSAIRPACRSGRATTDASSPSSMSSEADRDVPRFGMELIAERRPSQPMTHSRH